METERANALLTASGSGPTASDRGFKLNWSRIMDAVITTFSNLESCTKKFVILLVWTVACLVLILAHKLVKPSENFVVPFQAERTCYESEEMHSGKVKRPDLFPWSRTQ